MALTGPLIEGVVSPTADATTRKNALEGGNPVASGGYTQGARDPGSTQDQLAYMLTSQNRGNLNQTVGTAIGDAAYAPMTSAGQYQDLSKFGWVRNPDGTWTHSSSGRQVDATGTYEIGTGGGGGGGGGEEVTTETGEPTGPVGPGGPGGGLGQVSREAIEAQINALTAQYGLDLESIAALGGEIGAQAKFLLAQLNRDKGFAQEDMLGALVGRGVFRSGITARDTGRLEGDFAARRAQVEMNKGQQLRQLAERAGMAKIGLMRGKADVISQIDAGNLNAEVRQALLDELNTLSPEQVQQALANTQKPLPELELTDEDLLNRSTFYGGSSATSGYSPIKA